MAAANVILQNFDKGLRATWAPEQMATIAKLSRIFEENPVPTFVNAMLVRLAEAFKDGSNDVRVSIARALSQCGSQLTLAFSSAEIFRRILVVSHSNDPSAREATLDVLTTLAPIFPEHAQTHHMICESMSTEHDGEFRAACCAMKAFAELSSTFAADIVLRIGKLLEDSTICERRKAEICKVFSTMSANATTMDHVFEIVDVVINRSVSDGLLSEFLDATTSLCIEIRYAIPKQIDNLLHLLFPLKEEVSNSSRIRMLIVLRELKRLAGYSNIWKEEQVEKFNSCLYPTMSKSIIAKFFDVAIALTKNCPYSNLLVLKTLIASGSGYGSIPNPEISVRYVQLAANVYCYPRLFESQEKDVIESTMTSLSIIVIAACSHQNLKTSLARKLYRSVGDILSAFPYNSFEFSKMIISSIFSTFESVDSNQRHRLELLCRLVDTDRMFIGDVHKWSEDVYSRKKEIFDSYPKLFAFLCSAIGTENTIVPPVLFATPELLYETARTAFRNGKWRQVALPNLKGIQTKNMNRTEGDWLLALQELAESEFSEITVENLQAQQKHLRSSLAILKVSKETPRYTNQLRFPIDLLNCMLTTSEVYSHIISIVRVFTDSLSAALVRGQFFNPIVAKRFLTAIATVEKPINECLTKWIHLTRTSFCADTTSFDLIVLYSHRMIVLLSAVRVMLGKQSTESIVQLPQLTNSRTCSQYQHEMLDWANNRIVNLKYEQFPDLIIVRNFDAIFRHIASLPYMLPRFFFQQFYNVDIRISTTPQVEKNRSMAVNSTETIPIRVDGSIISDHPSTIRSVVVVAEVAFLTSPAHNFTVSETVEPTDKNFFSAQFLLSFKWSCEIKFRTEFVDSNCRKLWKSTSKPTVLAIIVRDSKTRQQQGQQLG